MEKYLGEKKKYPNIRVRIYCSMDAQLQVRTDGWPYIFLIPVLGYFLPVACIAWDKWSITGIRPGPKESRETISN